jgi:gamma-glutamyltranspeptidase/glutathione hydrolase
MVVAQEKIGAEVGAQVLRDGGNAMDAAIATAFALAVTYPSAGNIGGGGFIIYRASNGDAVAYDFREAAPAKAHARMFLKDGSYSSAIHHNSHLSVGVPGTVAGLYLAWQEHGKLPWKSLVAPAIKLAEDGFVVSHDLAGFLSAMLRQMQQYPASVAQFSRQGTPYQPGEILKQPDLAKTLRRIADSGPAGFYEGETASLIEKDMQANGGWITRDDLKAYRSKRREPIRGTYRGYEIISMPPPSSGGTALVEMLNILEGYDLAGSGPRSAQTVHLIVEAMRRAFADRARYLGDPDSNPTLPFSKLLSKEYAADLRKTIGLDRVSQSSPSTFEWPYESEETTHFSVVDSERSAVSLTYTLEQGYGLRAVVPGAGFLLNNEMGDFNASPGLTTVDGLIGTEPNLAAPGKRMLSSMTPTILTKDGKLFMVLGSPGGRTIINSVLLTILNVVDFKMNVQEAVDAPRFHHQWLPDRIQYERYGLSPDTVGLLERRGHTLQQNFSQGNVAAILFNSQLDRLEGAADRRSPDSAAAGW